LVHARRACALHLGVDALDQFIASGTLCLTLTTTLLRLTAVLLRPALALLEGRGDQAAVFIVDDKGKAQRISVRIAGFADDKALVAEGLRPGMKVVTSGAPYLRNGQPVSIESGVTGS
jgi:hypothetical protein